MKKVLSVVLALVMMLSVFSVAFVSANTDSDYTMVAGETRTVSLPGAVYDGMIFAKAQMAVYCTWMVELLWMAEWLSNGKTLDKQKMIQLLYRFSREVEHSDDNLKKLDKLMERKYIL